MPTELTLESLGKNIEDLKTLVAGIKVGGEEDEKKKLEAKKAEDEKKHEEKMEAKKAKYNAAIKAAAEEDDPDKKMAMVKSAQDEMDDKKHEAFGKPDEHKATEEEKEKNAQIASIINEKKNSMIKQILTANRIINPAGLVDVEARLKTASITEIQKEFDIVTPFIAGVPNQATQQPEKIIPYFANVDAHTIDSTTLTAASPDSEFANLSTKELLEMSR